MPAMPFDLPIARIFSGMMLLLGAWVMAIPLPAQIRPMLAEPQVRAVVVGVAQYQDPRIPALRFSHLDATAFADWLQSPAGGNVPAEYIRLLTNQQATNGNMVAAFSWLVEQSAKDDLAIIYFSGHGDMENQTVMNHGFLLAHDAPAANYMAGGFPIFYLQAIVRTLSTQKQSQVLLIADACRAGKLAGEDFSGSQATLKTMSDQFANEAKLLSCQPNEYSQEDQRWGNGHGVFTYYLIDGLTGLADRNQDQQVSLLEIQRYLEDHVPPAVAPKSQIPLVTGNKGMIVSQVDPESLEALRQLRMLGNREGIGPPAPSQPLSGLDSIVWQQYLLFGQALRERRLLEPEESAAFPIYQRIADHPLLSPYRSDMRLSLSAALLEDAQGAINDYLAASPEELRRRWTYQGHYERYARYLHTALELLGPGHFMERDILAKANYFEGLILRLDAEQHADPTLFGQARSKQEAVVALEPGAAYALNELGILARRERRYPESIDFFRHALAFSPTWVLARSNLCGSLIETGALEEALQECDQALQRDSSFALAHFNRGHALYQRNEFENAIAAFQKAVRLDPQYYSSWLWLGVLYWRTGRWQDMAATFAVADALRPPSLSSEIDLLHTGQSYFYRDQYQKALPFFQAIMDANPNQVEILYWTSKTLCKLDRFSEALTILERLDSLANSPSQTRQIPDEYRFNLAFSYLETSQGEKALRHFNDLMTQSPEDPDIWMGIVLSHALLKNKVAAMEALENALTLGLGNKDIDFLKQAPLLDDLRVLPEFQALLRQYPAKD